MNFQSISQTLSSYPPFLVVGVGAVALILIIWIGFKLLRKLFWTTIVTTVLAAIGVGIWFALK
jgi:hypothetical protein